MPSVSQEDGPRRKSGVAGRMCVPPPPPKFVCEVLTPSGMVFGAGGLWEGISVWGWDLATGWVDHDPGHADILVPDLRPPEL